MYSCMLSLYSVWILRLFDERDHVRMVRSHSRYRIPPLRDVTSPVAAVLRLTTSHCGTYPFDLGMGEQQLLTDHYHGFPIALAQTFLKVETNLTFCLAQGDISKLLHPHIRILHTGTVSRKIRHVLVTLRSFFWNTQLLMLDPPPSVTSCPPMMSSPANLFTMQTLPGACLRLHRPSHLTELQRRN